MCVLLNLTACQSIGYYAQSISGHTSLMLSRKPVDKVIAHVEPNIAQKLRLSKELKQFAVTELGLPDSKSYSSYVELNRDYPVWVVVAAPEFSLTAKHWCYPVIGCAAYRGYFSEGAAHKYAAKLTHKGWETHVGGASAYSTLGWFSDPLLSSMMGGSDVSFAELLFHELAHQKLYINGDSNFNEAFASVVGEQGALRWLSAKQPNVLSNYQASLDARRGFATLVEQLKADLNRVYDSTGSDEKKRLEKQVSIQAFRQAYQALKADHWQGKGYYDTWVAAPINNARLAAFSTYQALLPIFESIFKLCEQDFERFYRLLKSDQDVAKLKHCHP